MELNGELKPQNFISDAGSGSKRQNQTILLLHFFFSISRRDIKRVT